MDLPPCSYAEDILAGTTQVEGGFIRSTTVGINGKESVLPVVEVLDEALTSPLSHSTLRRKCFVSLPAICAAYGMLPSRYFPSGRLAIEHQSTVRIGYADVQRGTLDGLPVIVTQPVPYNPAGSVSEGGSQEGVYREIITWKNLNHPNILPLLGVDASASPLSTISAWMEYGSLREYLVRFPNAPRSKLLFDVSQGLEYMHNLDCIHGDLKSSNIIVNADHSGILANFRVASFLTESEVNTGVPVSECDPWSARWHAPEFLFPKKFGLDSARRTKETDVYAFAMVMYEAFSGSFPFKDLRHEAVILPIRSGDHPCRPEGGSDLGLTDELWKMMKACWRRRDRRWKISRIVSTLKRHSVEAAAETEGHSQPGEASPERYPRVTRWTFGASFRLRRQAYR